MTYVEDKAKNKTAPAAPPGTKLSGANKGAKVDLSQPQPGEEVIFVKFEEVYPDFEWNIRSPANVLADSEVDSGGTVESIAASMATRGQDFPLVLRANVHKKGPKLNHNRDGSSYVPYELVIGFRRFVAGEMLNKNEKNVEHSKKTGVGVIPNCPNGMMRAIVRKYDDLQAKLANGVENTGRNVIEPPDLMAHIVSLNRPPYSMSVGEIAENQALSLSTVHKYATVGSAIDLDIFRHWRLGGPFTWNLSEPPIVVGKRVSFDEIEDVSKKPKGDQPAAYKQLLLGKAEDAQSKDWFVAAGKAAVRQGVQLAKLEKEGVIKLTSKPWAECVPHLVKSPARLARKHVRPSARGSPRRMKRR